jgi:hypothetical protein
MTLFADIALPFFIFCLIRYFTTMHRGPSSRNRNRAVLPPFPQHHEPETSSKTSGSSLDRNDKSGRGHGNQEFYPSMEDVLDVRDLLRRMRPSAHGTVPDEIVDMIIDEAEYWPSVVTSLNTTPFMIGADGDKECLRTPPLCFSFNEGGENTSETLLHRGLYPCRKIIFDISSHDQGWGGDYGHQGTFRGSWTWFDAYIIPSNKKNSADVGKGGQESVSTERGEDTTSGPSPMKPFLPDSTKLQCNRTATKVPTNYHIVWHYKDSIQQDSSEAERIEEEEGRGRATLDGESVRTMQIGDQLVVWMRARFASWRNHVDSMSVRIFWAV